MTEHELRMAVVEQARSWLGCHESDGSHRPIIDLYNKFKRPGDYTMTYADRWCAAFSSAVGMAVAVAHSLNCKPYELIPASAACDPKIAAYKAMGRWVEDDGYRPDPGDEIFYDWEDSGSGDNHGSTDHVGVVTEMVGETITVIEGNKSDSVCYRSIQRDGRCIRGYGCPDYAKYAEGGDDPTPEPEPTPEPQPTPTPDYHYHSYQYTIKLHLLKRGDHGPQVASMQAQLNAKGFPCAADGWFGDETREALMNFQGTVGIAVDGEYGGESMTALLNY